MTIVKGSGGEERGGEGCGWKREGERRRQAVAMLDCGSNSMC